MTAPAARTASGPDASAPGVSGRRIAVVLFNLGGPDDQASVEPFLENLFSDPAIIGLPGLIRRPLARLISRRRGPEARANYALMGGGSPLLKETRRQAEALEAALAARSPGDETRVFIAMRYWSPTTAETAADVAVYGPDAVVLLPLYPQFSTTTTGSSLKLWGETYAGSGVTRAVCCYPEAQGWIAAQAALVSEALAGARADAPAPVRVLFSAHGVPERVISGRGDPYQAQVEATVRAVAAAAGLEDWSLCYQSRVGPLKWLGPSTPETLEQAARDGVGVVVVPIAFVSEHVETLVELDIEYGHLAETLGLPLYRRVPAVGVTPDFIDGLAQAVVRALARSEDQAVAPVGPGCPGDFAACPARAWRVRREAA